MIEYVQNVFCRFEVSGMIVALSLSLSLSLSLVTFRFIYQNISQPCHRRCLIFPRFLSGPLAVPYE